MPIERRTFPALAGAFALVSAVPASARASAPSGRRMWAFNGVADDMDEPLFRAERRRTVRLTIVNRSN